MKQNFLSPELIHYFNTLASNKEKLIKNIGLVDNNLTKPTKNSAHG